MDQGTKDLLQALAWLAGAVTAAVAVFKLIQDSRMNRQQRENELRWRQADRGKSLNDEMQTDEEAWAALEMLDEGGEEFEIDGKRQSITLADVGPVLAGRGTGRESVDRHIYDAFDNLFYFCALFDHYIDRKLILHEDVAYPMEYYVPRLALIKGAVDTYLTRYGPLRAAWYLERFSAWRAAPLDRGSGALAGRTERGSAVITTTGTAESDHQAFDT